MLLPFWEVFVFVFIYQCLYFVLSNFYVILTFFHVFKKKLPLWGGAKQCDKTKNVYKCLWILVCWTSFLPIPPSCLPSYYFQRYSTHPHPLQLWTSFMDDDPLPLTAHFLICHYAQQIGMLA